MKKSYSYKQWYLAILKLQTHIHRLLLEDFYVWTYGTNFNLEKKNVDEKHYWKVKFKPWGKKQL